MSLAAPGPKPAQPQHCSLCGVELSAGVLGSQCPRCLLSLATNFGLDKDDPAEEDLLDPLQVRSFGDYQLLQEIARGGMGVVYRARQISLDREVAVKMILAGELAAPAALRMFQTEAQAAANLHHPNIVPVYEIGEHEMQHYFSMRFVPGGRTIAHWAREKRGEFIRIAAAVAKVARAVAFAHERGVLHRDLKPSNILWDPSGEPQVTDFGLAKLLNAVDGSNTASVLMMGSPCYMAPEQTSGSAAQITTATDVYGIGALLYELLAGKPPFVGASVIETARLVNEAAPPALVNVPPDLRTVCMKCLAKRPADRYASATALAEDLDRFACGEPVSAVPLTALERVFRWARRRPKIAALLAVCALSLIGGISGVIWQWRKTETALVGQARALAHLQWQQIDQWLKDGETPRAVAYLASQLRENPKNTRAAMYAMSIVEQRAFPMLVGPAVHPPATLVVPARLSPDGTWFAGAGVDHMVRVWDCASSHQRAVLPQPAPITALAVTRGPALLAVATDNGTVAVYTALTKKPLVLTRTTLSPAQELIFSADGSLLLARSKEGVEGWNTGLLMAEPRVFDAGPDELRGVAVSGDGRRLLTWSGKHACVWEAATGAKLLSMDATQGYHRGTIAAGGQRVGLLDGRYGARTWDVDSKKRLAVIENALETVNFLAMDAAGTHLTLSTGGNFLSVYEVESGLKVSPVMEHHYEVGRLIVSGDGSRLCSYGYDDVVNIWNSSTGVSVMSPLGFGKIRTAADLSASNSADIVLVHSRSDDREPELVSVWRGTQTKQPQLHVVEGCRDFDVCRISPDGRLGCLALGPMHRCQVYEFASGRVLLDKPAEGGVYVGLFSPDGTRLYVATAGGWVFGWSLKTGEELWKPCHFSAKVRPGVLSPDGSRMILGYNDGHIRIVDTATGTLLRTLDHEGEIKTLDCAPDQSGRFIAGSRNGSAYVWNMETGQRLQSFIGHRHAIISAKWHPDGRHVATASYDSTARIWDVITGAQVSATMTHSTWLSHVEFSPDGSLLVASGRDGIARLWHFPSGEPAGLPIRQGATLDFTHFTHDGLQLLVRDLSGFRFWDIHDSEPVTIHYQEPEISGLGMDSECSTAALSPDESHVFLGSGMNHGALWSIARPRGAVPVWFADFLESLCLLHLGEHEGIGLEPGERLLRLRSQIDQATADDSYAAWARQVLGTGPR